MENKLLKHFNKYFIWFLWNLNAWSSNWSATGRISYSNHVFWDSPFVFAELSPMAYKWRNRTDAAKWRHDENYASVFQYICVRAFLNTLILHLTYFAINNYTHSPVTCLPYGLNMSLWSLVFRASYLHSRTVWGSSYFSDF